MIVHADNIDYQYPSLVKMDSETHGGDDVMVFARGPWAHLFTGNMEQNEIPLAMAMAAGISTEPPTSGSGGSNLVGQITLIVTALLGLRRFFW